MFIIYIKYLIKYINKNQYNIIKDNIGKDFQILYSEENLNTNFFLNFISKIVTTARKIL